MSDMIDPNVLISKQVKQTYPSLEVLTPNDNIVIVLPTLKTGDMPLIIEFNGVRKIVAYISKSAINIDMLIRICGALKFEVSESNSQIINTAEEYLEVLIAWT